MTGLRSLLIGATLVFACAAHGYEQRFNCGGPAYTAVSGDLFAADQPYSAGGAGYVWSAFADDTWEPIRGTPDDFLYETVRMGSYRFDVPNGWYLLTVHVCDFWSHGPRQNQYDVLADGTQVIADLDIYAEVGKDHPMVFRFAVEITDGALDVDTHVDRRHAYLNALEVESIVPDSDAPAIPVGLVGYDGYNRTSLRWDPNTESDLAGYRVYRKTEPAGSWVLLTATPRVATWYHDDTAVVGTSYRYRIRAIDVFGNQSADSPDTPASPRSIATSTRPVYEIFMDLADLDVLNTDEATQGDEYFPATFVAGGQVFQNVGVRYRGNITRTLPKKSWKVRFNDDELFTATDRLNLIAEYPDMSFMREYLAYEMLRESGLPSSTSRMINLMLNGEYMGVFNDVQQVDEIYLLENGFTVGGDLYKCESDFSVLPDTTAYEAAYENETNPGEGYGDLIDLILRVNETPTDVLWQALAPDLDIQNAVMWYSINVFLANMDFRYKNYYVYHDESADRWSFIPWDVDFTFGKVAIFDQSYYSASSLFLGSAHKWASRIQSTPALRRLHLENMTWLANDILTPAVWVPRIQALHADLTGDVTIDWSKFAVTDLAAFEAGELGIETFLTDRGQFVRDSAPAVVTDDGLVINEFMARNATTVFDEAGEPEDWIEIYNGSPGAKDLTGMYLTDDPENTTKWPIPPLVLEPGGYALFWADDSVAAGPMHTNFRLDGDGEFVGLFESLAAANVPLDVQYFGPQLVDVSRGRYGEGELYWTAFGNPSPGGAANGPPNDPPVISGTTHTPAFPGAMDPIDVSASIQDPDGIVEALVVFSDGAVVDSLAMADDGASGDGEAGDGVFGATIPAQPDGTTLDYFIHARDGAGVSATDPIGAPGETYVVAVGYAPPPLTVNEFMADNTASYADESGDFDDWVEIHNGGTTPVQLGDMTLTDDLLVPTKWAFPDTILAPGGFLVVFCDNEPGEGPLHATFRLGADGEEIGLFERVALGGGQLDAITFGAQRPDISYGRYPDGGAALQFFGIPTPGAPNEPGNAPPNITDVAISPDPPAADSPVVVTAEIVDDASVAEAHLLYDATGAEEFVPVRMWDDGLHGDGVGGDRVYGASIPGYPDGTVVRFYLEAEDGEGLVTADPPAGAEAPYGYQIGYVSPALAVNEIMALNTTTIADEMGEFDDWVEILNDGPDAVDLGGLYLSDDLEAPTAWALPETTLAPGGFLLVWCDATPEQGPLHASFRLSADGEEIGLFESESQFFALIDGFSFAAQMPDTSYGRFPDGSGALRYMPIPTPGAPNELIGAPESPGMPGAFTMHAASPNPFRSRVALSFDLPEERAEVRLMIYDVAGRRVRTLVSEPRRPGRHLVVWNGRTEDGLSCRPGVYFVRLTAGADRALRKLIKLE